MTTGKILIPAILLLMSGCNSTAAESANTAIGDEETAVFTSSDKNLEKTYRWAKKTALGYAHDNGDPVGAWYEAALPQREAFCMRDVSHQTVGAHILGLAKHNKNMMRKFASNISESRDYCSYWEINRYDKPAPADYASDSEFWYNLNANFDVMQACLRMYEWTADRDYISDKDFTDFYDISAGPYLDRWQLRPESIMDRPRYMNQAPDFNESNNFHSCRGLASYVENFRGLTVGVDLLAALQGGFRAYSRIEALNGNSAKSAEASAMADAYREIIDTRWWDTAENRYNTFWTTERKFYRGEGVPFILWFDATNKPERKQACVADILTREWNVENMSAFPKLFYDLGYNEEAYRFLTTLPATNRSEYPEVSYGLVEGIVCGAMGLNPSFSSKSVSSLSRIDSNFCEIKNVPLFDGFISLRHDGMKSSCMKNDTGTDLEWKASFQGEHQYLYCGADRLEASVTTDVKGNKLSYVTVTLPAKSEKAISVVKD